MSRWTKSVATFALFLLPSCVGLQPTLPSTAKPGASGYVAGFLVRGEGEGFALKLLENATGREYVMGFERDDDGAHPVMIEVLPGTYRVASWMTYNAMHERVSQQEIPETHVLARSFTVGAGQVVLLGSLEASTAVWQEPVQGRTQKITTSWMVSPRRITEAAAVAALRESFPEFAGAPVTCLACAADGAPEPVPTPEREFQLRLPTRRAPSLAN
jgi:hypothetical protein